MAYLLDGAVILIFILFVWVGSRRGLVRSVLRLISCVVSLVLALWLGSAKAPMTACISMAVSVVVTLGVSLLTKHDGGEILPLSQEESLAEEAAA